MKTLIIVSVVGKDQEGFINKLTLKTKELSGRWLANKIAHLDGQIAGLLKMEIDTDKLDAFKSMMSEFKDINVDYHDVSDQPDQQKKVVSLTLEGEDRSGLTSDITHLLYDQDVQVTHFESQRYPVTGLGTGVFEAHLSVHLPTTVSLDQLKQDLESLSDRMRVFVAEAS
jgi:glycine cleavage system regulatory protein